MSADNGIYIAKFKSGYRDYEYRVSECQAIENCDYSVEFPDKIIDAYRVLYFGHSPVFKTIDMALDHAHKLSAKTSFLEYGIGTIDYNASFPKISIDEASDLVNDYFDNWNDGWQNSPDWAKNELCPEIKAAEVSDSWSHIFDQLDEWETDNHLSLGGWKNPSKKTIERAKKIAINKQERNWNVPEIYFDINSNINLNFKLMDELTIYTISETGLIDIVYIDTNTMKTKFKQQFTLEQLIGEYR